MILSELPPGWYPVFGLAELLLMTGAAIITVRAVSLRLKFPVSMAAAVLLAAAWLLGQGTSDLSLERDLGWPYSRLAMQMMHMDCRYLTGLLLILGIAEAVFLFFLNQKIRTGLSQDAVKEAMDTLTDGICFSERNGAPLLVNEQMNQICAQMNGTQVLNANAFWKALNEKREEELKNLSVSAEDQEAERKALYVSSEDRKAEPEALFVSTQNGDLWSFTRRTIRLEKEKTRVQEIIAYNAAEEVRLLQEQKERTQRLEQIHLRLSQYGKEVLQTAREKEILSAKIRIHDKTGQCLLAWRAYLAQPEEERSRKELLRMWEETSLLMSSEAATQSSSDEWQLLREAAAAVDVKIHVEGELPAEGEARELLIMAVHECLTNTVKHADGDRLDVRVIQGETIHVGITNNGNPPKGEIQETGGLGNLRERVRQANGRMHVEALPRFRLILELEP